MSYKVVTNIKEWVRPTNFIKTNMFRIRNRSFRCWCGSNNVKVINGNSYRCTKCGGIYEGE